MDTDHRTQDGQTTDPTPPADEPPIPRTRWFGWSPLAGLLVAVPSGWLLAYLAALPFMLGLFFFLLLGLIVGAVMYRIGTKSPVPSASVLWLAGSAVAVMMMLTSLWAEYHALPRSVEKRVRDSYFESFTPERRDALSRGVKDYVRAELENRYPPGGFVGYLRWAATSGRLECPRILRKSTAEYRLSHRRALWLIRVGLAALMVEWTILSQLFGLRSTPRRNDDQEPAEPAVAAPPGG